MTKSAIKGKTLKTGFKCSAVGWLGHDGAAVVQPQTLAAHKERAGEWKWSQLPDLLMASDAKQQKHVVD